MEHSQDEHEWRAVSFVGLGTRPGGGIANVTKRVCPCGAVHKQVEVSWPSGRITVEPYEPVELILGVGAN